MDFSGIYRDQQFWKEKDAVRLELSDISGTNCYCDGEAFDEIRKRLEEYPAGGIFFIDSGNYHYVSRIGADKIKEPFRLLVLDNHTDMQLPAFGGLLSCGGWIASALEELPDLKEVWLVGPDEEAYSQVEERFRSRVKFLSREELDKARKEGQFLAKWENWLQECAADFIEGYSENQPPFYISIDKDVLCKADASTTWSQGDMTLEELLAALTAFTERLTLENGRILQVDICGECDQAEGMEKDKNEHANKVLLDYFSNALPSMPPKNFS